MRPVAHHCKGTLTIYEGKVGRSSDLVYVHQVLGGIRGNTPGNSFVTPPSSKSTDIVNDDYAKILFSKQH